ncbi:hypothetical protein ACOMHN_026135 [Nucella lapillus]
MTDPSVTMTGPSVTIQ